MERFNPIRVMVDPGHGGQDNGAQWNGRLEKDDNLRLGLAVRDALARQGLKALMTHDSDAFVSLENRVMLANENNVDLFISLHRNSSDSPTSTANGFENFIYLTAPNETSGHAARLVSFAIDNVGGMNNRGVSRGNYYVLRRTTMPSMLLELGFINNARDNLAFDQNLSAYAEAIAKGVMEYFGLQYQPPASITPPIGVVPPVTPIVPPIAVLPLPLRPTPRQDRATVGQEALNSYFGSGLTVDGVFGPATKRAAIRALQQEINDSRNTNIAVDGVFGPETRAALPTLREGDRGNAVALLQILLSLHGYDPRYIDGIFGPLTKTAVTIFQRDHFLVPDGIAGPGTFAYLLQ